jgi:cyanate permease
MLPGFLLAASAVQIRSDVGLSLTGLGLLIGVFFGTAALVSPTAGQLAERVGWAASLRLAGALAAIGLGGMGLLGNSLLTFAAFLVFGGLASALSQIASNLAVARCVRPERQGFVFGLRHASVPASALLAGLAIPSIALTAGWRWSFFAGVLLSLVAIAAVPHSEQPYTLNPPLPTGPSEEKPRPATPLALLILLSIAVGLGTGGGDTLGGFIVSYSVEAGLTESAAGLMLSLGSLAGLVARVVAGLLIDKRHTADLTSVAGMITTGAVGIMLLNLGGEAGLYGGAMLAFTAAWGWAGLFTFAIVKDNPEAPAAASGITQTGKYIGAAAGPPIFGFIADRVSFTAAWWFSTVVLLMAASLILYVRNQRPQ